VKNTKSIIIYANIIKIITNERIFMFNYKLFPINSIYVGVSFLEFFSCTINHDIIKKKLIKQIEGI
jgi:hypothetical protein